LTGRLHRALVSRHIWSAGQAGRHLPGKSSAFHVKLSFPFPGFGLPSAFHKNKIKINMDLAKILKQLNSKELRTLILVGFLAGCAVIAWLFFSPKGILTYYHLRKEIEAVKAENMQLQEENRLLQQKIEKIKNDPAYLEELARQEYDMLKKDELLFEFK
jgi:cell division protein FtsB